MRKDKALRLAAGIVSTALFLSIPSVIARADSFISSEQGIAGISAVLENTTEQELQDAYNASVTEIEKEENVSPYENLGVSIADDFVNIRKKASTESDIVGRLYRGCAADILETLDSGWVKIKSGKVEGYIATQFLAIGDEANEMVDKYATKYATVKTQTLYVRAKKSTDAKILTMIPDGETYVVTKEYDKWVEILLGNDEDTGGDYTGFVSKDYIKIDVEFKYAMTMEEIKRQEEAVQAEKERKEKKAQEEAEKKEADRKAAEQAKEDSKNNSKNSNSNSGSSSGSNKTTTHSSGKTSDIVAYALKFVGNRYVWGGTSLTNGADCSGFVQSIYGDFGYSIPRTSRSQAVGAGIKVSESDLQPGDLIFYANGGTVNHVAMYIGNGKIVHAANSRQGIITSQYRYRDIYCARRIVH